MMSKVPWTEIPRLSSIPSRGPLCLHLSALIHLWRCFTLSTPPRPALSRAQWHLSHLLQNLLPATVPSLTCIPALRQACLYLKKTFSLLTLLNILFIVSFIFKPLEKNIRTASNKLPSSLFYWYCSLESTKTQTAPNQAFSWSSCFLLSPLPFILSWASFSNIVDITQIGFPLAFHGPSSAACPTKSKHCPGSYT